MDQEVDSGSESALDTFPEETAVGFSTATKFVIEFVKALNGEPKSQKLAFLHHAAREFVNFGIEPPIEVFEDMAKVAAVNEQTLVPIETPSMAVVETIAPERFGFKTATGNEMQPPKVVPEQTLAEQIIDHGKSKEK